MDQQTTLVIATKNANKVRELSVLMKDFPVIIKSLVDFPPIPEVIEDGCTFDDNAYKKAAFTARILGVPTLADDSGLCVDALGGAPGVWSARYGGPDITDQQRCEKLLESLRGKENRAAAFECVISIAVPTGAALTYEGRCEGVIADAPSGENGFGYDPVFYFPEFKKTFAQLSAAEKNRVSHRGRALAEVKNEFDKVLAWISQQMPVFEKVSCKES